jgi:uncharacterized membrane protein (UPF0136 family)
MLGVAMIATVGFYLIFFGVVTAAGGVMGFLKAKSKASLIAGTISGALLVVAGMMARQGNRMGVVLGLVVSLALPGRFGVVFAKTRAMIPAGIMLLLATIGIVLTAASFL